MDRKRSGFNHLESFFEVDIMPNELRKIADEIDQVMKSDLYIPGQVIRYKLSSKFVIVCKPEKRPQLGYEVTRELLPDGTDTMTRKIKPLEDADDERE